MQGAALAELPYMDLAFMDRPRTLPLAPHADALRDRLATIPASFDARTAWPHCPSSTSAATRTLLFPPASE